MDMGVYVLLRRRVHYILAAEVQPDIEQALKCPAANRLDAVIVPVTRMTIKAIFSREEVETLGGQSAVRITQATATD